VSSSGFRMRHKRIDPAGPMRIQLFQNSVDWLVSSGWLHMDPVVPDLSIHEVVSSFVTHHSVDWLVSSGWSHMDPVVPDLSIHRSGFII
jgi:hypothetical protein